MMETSQYKLSIVIPTSVDRIESLKTLFSSFLQQDFFDDLIEILVVCNPDSQLVHKFMEDLLEGSLFPPSCTIRYVFRDKKGANRARNFGAKLAQGEYLLFLDDDTSLSHDLYLFQLHLLLKQASKRMLKAAGGHYLSFSDYPLANEKSFFGFMKVLPTFIYNTAANFWLLNGYINQSDCRFLGGCFLIERTFFNQLGGFDSEARGAGEEAHLSQKINLKPCSESVSLFEVIPQLSVNHVFQGGYRRLLKNAFTHGVFKGGQAQKTCAQGIKRSIRKINILSHALHILGLSLVRLNSLYREKNQLQKLWIHFYQMVLHLFVLGGLVIYFFVVNLGLMKGRWLSQKNMRSSSHEAFKFKKNLENC